MTLKYINLKNINGMLNFFKTLNFDLLLRLNITNSFMLPFINKIICNVTLNNIRNEVDLKIINSLIILDLFFAKKTEVDTLIQRYLHKSKTIIFVSKSTLVDKYNYFLFLFLILKVIKPSLKKRYIYLKFKIFNDGFSFYITDIGCISEISEELKKDKIFIKISVYFNKYFKKKVVLFFLKYFGLRKKI